MGLDTLVTKKVSKRAKKEKKKYKLNYNLALKIFFFFWKKSKYFLFICKISKM